jgi:hypothetical protein
MKRFKTKQEFEKEFGKDWKTKTIPYAWSKYNSMDYLFGCIYSENFQECVDTRYAKFLTDDNCWSISEEMLTTKPHPYSKGKWYVEVPEGKHDIVQAKALTCGFKWYSNLHESKWFYNFHNECLLIDNSELLQGLTKKILKSTKLTFDQFMNGDVPDQEEVLKIMCIEDHQLRVTNSSNGSVNPLEEIFSIENRLELGYKLVTKEEFYKLTKKPLRFRDWEIEKIGNSAIKVGRYGYCLDGVKEFSNNLSMMFNHYPDITIEEIKEIPKLIDKI